MADNLTPKLLPTDVLQDQRLERPEDDLFTAKAIAGRVAELLAGTQHPVHVGVFGAWGSGKSSFLQLVESELEGLAGKSVGAVNYPKKFRVVRYDAWRYGGQALRRDLIAVASRKLGVKRRRYTEGLFESRQVVRLEVDELLRRLGSFVAGVAALALALGVFGGLVWSGIWFLSELFDGIKDPSDVVKDMSVPWGKVTAVVTGVLAVLNAPSLLGVSVNRSLPSQDDEFARNLRELVREAEMPRMLRWASNWERFGAKIRARSHCKVIFFIDELDRATDREVLDTLTALQTQFAGAKVSVVVAADRDVLESALDDVHRQGPNVSGIRTYQAATPSSTRCSNTPSRFLRCGANASQPSRASWSVANLGSGRKSRRKDCWTTSYMHSCPVMSRGLDESRFCSTPMPLRPGSLRLVDFRSTGCVAS